MAKKYVWLKLKEDFFQQKSMKKLRRMAGGATFTLIYLKMQLLSLKNAGKIYFDRVEEEFADELALELDESPEDVQMTLLFLQKNNLLEIGEIKDEFVLPEVVGAIGSETSSAERMRKMRAKKAQNSLEMSEKKITNTNKNITCNNNNVTSSNNQVTMLHNSYEVLQDDVTNTNLEKIRVLEGNCNNVTQQLHQVTNSYTEKEIDKDKEREEEIEIEKTSSSSFDEKLLILKNWIKKATSSNEFQVDMVLRPPYYKDNIDEVLNQIEKSKFLRGEAERKPTLQTFTVLNQIEKIVAGFYKDFETSKNQVESLQNLEYPKNEWEW